MMLANRCDAMRLFVNRKDHPVDDDNELVRRAELTGQSPGGATELSDDAWRQRLTPEQYQVLRQKGTEAPFTGAYVENHETGEYDCAACGLPLFHSDAKFESGSGWPSFYRPVADAAVVVEHDQSHGMIRTEVMCGRCGSHLGHVFPDGPMPTGQRFCINSVSLHFDAGAGDTTPI